MFIDPARPYRGAAYYYAEYRYQIGEVFARLVAVRLGLTARDRILDLGCGPGGLGMRFAPHVGEVVAADPEPDMLDEGRRRCAEAGIDNVMFVGASSNDLTGVPHRGGYRLVTIGQAFHWMRPHDSTLRRLSRFAGRSADVVLLSPEVLTYRPDWWSDVEALVNTYLAGTTAGEHPSGRHANFTEVLRRSPFSRVEELRLEYDVVEQPSLRAALGLWYSMPWVLERLGPRRTELDAAARDRLGWIDSLPARVVRRRDVALFGLRPATAGAA